MSGRPTRASFSGRQGHFPSSFSPSKLPTPCSVAIASAKAACSWPARGNRSLDVSYVLLYRTSFHLIDVFTIHDIVSPHPACRPPSPARGKAAGEREILNNEKVHLRQPPRFWSGSNNSCAFLPADKTRRGIQSTKISTEPVTPRHAAATVIALSVSRARKIHTEKKIVRNTSMETIKATRDTVLCCSATK